MHILPKCLTFLVGVSGVRCCWKWWPLCWKRKKVKNYGIAWPWKATVFSLFICKIGSELSSTFVSFAIMIPNSSLQEPPLSSQLWAHVKLHSASGCWLFVVLRVYAKWVGWGKGSCKEKLASAHLMLILGYLMHVQYLIIVKFSIENIDPLLLGSANWGVRLLENVCII